MILRQIALLILGILIMVTYFLAAGQEPFVQEQSPGSVKGARYWWIEFHEKSGVKKRSEHHAYWWEDASGDVKRQKTGNSPSK